jgi:antagonist of KipI
MSLKIIKAGILDSIQDIGRYGYQRFGINPTGAMDVYSCRLGNLLVGNDENTAVIEMHFPCSTVLFEKAAVIALTGADFSATIDHQFIEMNAPVQIAADSIIQFTNPRHGARCYMAVAGGFE